MSLRKQTSEEKNVISQPEEFVKKTLNIEKENKHWVVCVLTLQPSDAGMDRWPRIWRPLTEIKLQNSGNADRTWKRNILLYVLASEILARLYNLGEDPTLHPLHFVVYSETFINSMIICREPSFLNVTTLLSKSLCCLHDVVSPTEKKITLHKIPFQSLNRISGGLKKSRFLFCFVFLL